MIKNNKLKEINLKNHTRYYFDDMISMNDLDNMLLNKKKTQKYFDILR